MVQLQLALVTLNLTQLNGFNAIIQNTTFFTSSPPIFLVFLVGFVLHHFFTASLVMKGVGRLHLLG